MDKILSIIIPTYNMEKYLRRCLDSLIVKENFEMLEVWVVNDGSKDSSSAIAHEYSDKYPTVFNVIDKPNGNYGSCINAALPHCTGKYVKVLDADDRYENKKISPFLHALSLIDVDMVVTDSVFVDSQDSVTRNRYQSFLPKEKVVTFASVVDDIMANDVAMYEKTFKLINLKKMGYKQTEGISYTDTEWAIIPMVTVKTVYYFPHIIYRYFLGREGQTVDPAIYKKGLKQRMKIGIGFSKDYDSLIQQSDATQKKYLESKMLNFVDSIYRGIVLDNYTSEAFVDFDDQIKNNSSLMYLQLEYKPLDKHVSYKYIKNIRNRINKEKLPMLIRTYILLKSIHSHL